MSIVQVIRTRNCPEVPWKNGGGTTREIAVFPPGAGMDEFLWRLSMARVEHGGAFSTFLGIDRTLAVLEGTLQLEGDGVDIRLDPQSAPFPFDGGAQIYGEPAGGPVLDLNAMTRRGECTVKMARRGPGPVTASSSASFLVLLEPQDLESSPMEALDCAVFTGKTLLEGDAIQIDFISEC
ncbi:HutD family protein [Novosphingobium sp. PhB165]|uniref:HutD/Ves family protein n=1 Tax=Novosphingobium sp. PhB165 TaxID=2485105 RepID=UPI00104BA7AE|nr:HutD family protein [Novosphingobium sp. PhB165]